MRYNIIQHLNILVCGLCIFFTLTQHALAQELSLSKYGTMTVNSMTTYRETTGSDSLKKMADISAYIPNIILDLRYAGTDNFMHRRMYPRGTTHSFLRLRALKVLASVQTELNTRGLGLKIFDAYRPYSVTEKFWELVHDDRYVADPKNGSGHNRGIAIDLTIIDLKSGQELTMPTGFDSFTDSAHHDFANLSQEILDNRKLLKETMEKYGFIAFQTEWWHYSLPNPENYEVLDLSFRSLEKNSSK
ncbi:MAG: M15 family metallopeptidase [Chitinophagales bacterium]